MKRYFEGMAKLEKTFPPLVNVARAVATIIERHSRAKGIKEDGVILDVAKWHPDGTVTIQVSLNPEAKRDTANDGAMPNFNTLAEINKKYPQAVELAMSLAFQLVGVVNNKKLIPSEIGTTPVQWSESRSMLRFRMLAFGLPLTPPIQVRI